jgi:hypothetical protein
MFEPFVLEKPRPPSLETSGCWFSPRIILLFNSLDIFRLHTTILLLSMSFIESISISGAKPMAVEKLLVTTIIMDGLFDGMSKSCGYVHRMNLSEFSG